MLTRSHLVVAALSAVLVLAGCGNDASVTREKAAVKEIAGFLRSRVIKGDTPAAESAADPNVMISNALATFGGAPLTFVVSEKTGAYAVASVYGSNGDVTTWATRDLMSFSLRRGMLTATRGIGNDLMSVEDGGASRMIVARQSGTVEKTYRFLDGLDRPNRLILQCDIIPGETQPVQTGEISTEAQVVREACHFGTFKVTNTYWVDYAGRMVQSVQWAGAANGQLIFRRLRW